MSQTILDLGCGASDATLELAARAGPDGRVIAVDLSRAELDLLLTRARARGLTNITTLECDLDEIVLQPDSADSVWSRCIGGFLNDPRRLLSQIHRALKAGGIFVSEEYLDYGSCRLARPSPELDALVDLVIDAWPHMGGEPSPGLEIACWLRELGFDVRVTPLVQPEGAVWQWPRAFVESSLRHLRDADLLDPAGARAILQAFNSRETAPELNEPTLLETVGSRTSRS
jgi:SAM-dependent methyltransferase